MNFWKYFRTVVLENTLANVYDSTKDKLMFIVS